MVFVFGDGGSGALEMFFFLFMFAAILFLAYFTTKIVAKKTGIRARSKYMEVIDRLDFGANSQLFILRAGNECFLVSKTQKELNVLTKVSLDGLLTEADAGARAEAEIGFGMERRAASSGDRRDFRAILEKHLSFGAIKAPKESVFRKIFYKR